MSTPPRFGSYELYSLLGRGGMARVYRARRVGPHGFSKEVALKILDQGATASESQIAALTDEARLGGLLRHPNIVVTDDFGKVGQHYFIAMELVDGWTLDALLREQFKTGRAVHRAVALDVLIAVCAGLAHAHELRGGGGEALGLVHRDVKPGNVMISRRGEVKLMDFGIAKAATNVYLTQAKTTRGTPLFMSPEQVMGEDLDGRSDLFSLGGMLHELVTLRPTFRSTEMVAVLRAVLDVDIGEATERVRAIWPEILPVFLKLMKELPADRYPDARMVARDLRRLRAAVGPGMSVAQWVASLASSLPVPQEGELGEAVPQGVGSPLGGLPAFDPVPALAPAVPSAFKLEMPEPAQSSGALAALPSPGPNPSRAPKLAPSAAAPLPDLFTGSTPAAPPVDAPKPPPRAPRPGAPRRRGPVRQEHSTRPKTWQRRAARRAALGRLVTFAAVGLALLFAGTFLPGAVGDAARGIWQSLSLWVRAITGG